VILDRIVQDGGNRLVLVAAMLDDGAGDDQQMRDVGRGISAFRTYRAKALPCGACGVSADI
jgi:hypothetical protein